MEEENLLKAHYVAFLDSRSKTEDNINSQTGEDDNENMNLSLSVFIKSSRTGENINSQTDV